MNILSSMALHPLRIGALALICACLSLAARQNPGAGPTADDLGRLLLESRGQANKGDVSRQFMLACMRENAWDKGISALDEFLETEGDEIRSTTLNPRRLNALLSAADALNILIICRTRGGLADIQPQTLDWLFSTNGRLGTIVEHVSPRDDWAGFLNIVNQLAAHDPDDRDTFLPLILSLAFVWDQPRPPLHHQIGAYQLSHEPEIVNRYDYFKDLYASGKAGIRLDRLSIRALMFVVDTPVPIDELVWARDTIRGSTANWGRKFKSIDYDYARLERGAYSWQAGPYTLASIEELGGICVDQAYYTVIGARAHGIPAMIFTGMGRRGPHAWVGYMKSETDWEMDIGRYDYDRYATGQSVDPQTNTPMTDHDVDYSCSRTLKSTSASLASRYTRIADAFLRLSKFDAAQAFAAKAVSLTPLYEAPWRIVERVLEQQGKDQELARLLSRKATVFQRFPDYLVGIRAAQAEVLRRLGKDAEAERLLNTLENKLSDDRGDLAGDISLDRIHDLIKHGDTTGARKKLEKLMRDQKNEGTKVFELIQTYLRMTEETGQTKEALRFLKIYLDRVKVSESDERALLEFEIQAYENAGDQRGAERLRRRL
ncbi:MAG: hypothetical protein RRC34_12345 [Lentisphaeria bacterium]|nr:hypothetical protein [Lentisphaeria bacterium]